MSVGERPNVSPGVSRFLAVLTDNPLVVVVGTLAVAVTATGVLILAVPGMHGVIAMGIFAVIWGLVLAIVIRQLAVHNATHTASGVGDGQAEVRLAAEVVVVAGSLAGSLLPTTPDEPTTVSITSSTTPAEQATTLTADPADPELVESAEYLVESEFAADSDPAESSESVEFTEVTVESGSVEYMTGSGAIEVSGQSGSVESGTESDGLATGDMVDGSVLPVGTVPNSNQGLLAVTPASVDSRDNAPVASAGVQTQPGLGPDEQSGGILVGFARRLRRFRHDNPAKIVLGDVREADAGRVSSDGTEFESADKTSGVAGPELVQVVVPVGTVPVVPFALVSDHLTGSGPFELQDESGSAELISESAESAESVGFGAESVESAEVLPLVMTGQAESVSVGPKGTVLVPEHLEGSGSYGLPVEAVESVAEVSVELGSVEYATGSEGSGSIGVSGQSGSVESGAESAGSVAESESVQVGLVGTVPVVPPVLVPEHMEGTRSVELPVGGDVQFVPESVEFSGVPIGSGAAGQSESVESGAESYGFVAEESVQVVGQVGMVPTVPVCAQLTGSGSVGLPGKSESAESISESAESVGSVAESVESAEVPARPVVMVPVVPPVLVPEHLEGSGSVGLPVESQSVQSVHESVEFTEVAVEVGFVERMAGPKSEWVEFGEVLPVRMMGQAETVPAGIIPVVPVVSPVLVPEHVEGSESVGLPVELGSVQSAPESVEAVEVLVESGSAECMTGSEASGSIKISDQSGSVGSGVEFYGSISGSAEFVFESVAEAESMRVSHGDSPPDSKVVLPGPVEQGPVFMASGSVEIPAESRSAKYATEPKPVKPAAESAPAPPAKPTASLPAESAPEPPAKPTPSLPAESTLESPAQSLSADSVSVLESVLKPRSPAKAESAPAPKSSTDSDTTSETKTYAGDTASVASTNSDSSPDYEESTVTTPSLAKQPVLGEPTACGQATRRLQTTGSQTVANQQEYPSDSNQPLSQTATIHPDSSGSQTGTNPPDSPVPPPKPPVHSPKPPPVPPPSVIRRRRAQQAAAPVPPPTPANPAEPRDPPEPTIPEAYLDILQRETGVGLTDIRRAWSPNPRGGGPWVVENNDGARWSIIQSRSGRLTVIALGVRDPSDRVLRERAEQVAAEQQAAEQQAQQARLARRVRAQQAAAKARLKAG